MTRAVIVHYHLFKNAGTSLDLALAEAFGATHVATIEAQRPDGELMPEAVAACIQESSDVTVVTSHTALLPPPSIHGVDIIPALFLREPLLRAYSIWAFERDQDIVSVETNAARQLGFAGYVDWRLGRDASLSNFQSYRLGKGGVGETRFARAQDALDRLPFVGLVERFSASLRELTVILDPYFPGIALNVHHVNARKEPIPDIEALLGPDLYSRLRDANHEDSYLWDRLTDRYDGWENNT